MSREDYDALRALKRERQLLAEQRRCRAAEEFPRLKRLAAQGGFVLRMCSDQHYRLMQTGQFGWSLNIYPGNQRIYRDLNRREAPFLPLPPVWGVEEVVNAAIAAVKGDTSSEQQQQDAEDVRGGGQPGRLGPAGQAEGCPEEAGGSDV